MSLIKLSKYILICCLSVTVFLVGYLPQRNRSLKLERQSQKLASEVDLANLRAELAMSAFEAERKNFSQARERSANFFSGINKQIGQTQSKKRRDRLERIASKQKEIDELLAKNDKKASEKMAQLYIELYEVSTPLPERMAKEIEK